MGLPHMWQGPKYLNCHQCLPRKALRGRQNPEQRWDSNSWISLCYPSTQANMPVSQMLSSIMRIFQGLSAHFQFQAKTIFSNGHPLQLERRKCGTSTNTTSRKHSGSSSRQRDDDNTPALGCPEFLRSILNIQVQSNASVQRVFTKIMQLLLLCISRRSEVCL